MARKAQNEFVKCTACTPKGTPRYSTAPTGTFGIGPVGQAVPRGTVQLCPWPKGFASGCTVSLYRMVHPPLEGHLELFLSCYCTSLFCSCFSQNVSPSFLLYQLVFPQ